MSSFCIEKQGNKGDFTGVENACKYNEGSVKLFWRYCDFLLCKNSKKHDVFVLNKCIDIRGSSK